MGIHSDHAWQFQATTPLNIFERHMCSTWEGDGLGLNSSEYQTGEVRDIRRIESAPVCEEVKHLWSGTILFHGFNSRMGCSDGPIESNLLQAPNEELVPMLKLAQRKDVELDQPRYHKSSAWVTSILRMEYGFAAMHLNDPNKDPTHAHHPNAK
ncbi:hypothetical protein RhiJN_09557 [Ceratobasidium sp. AG-Ba]|nr:hypothetical protein RhiJN_09557 [Ceratobasidium sp. AG-Ba]